MLLEHGADPSITDSFGITPLQQATNNGHHNVVNLLQTARRPHVQEPTSHAGENGSMN